MPAAVVCHLPVAPAVLWTRADCHLKLLAAEVEVEMAPTRQEVVAANSTGHKSVQFQFLVTYGAVLGSPSGLRPLLYSCIVSTNPNFALNGPLLPGRLLALTIHEIPTLLIFHF